MYACSMCGYSKKLHLGCDSAECNPHRYLMKMKQMLAQCLYDAERWHRKSQELFKKSEAPTDAAAAISGAEAACAAAPSAASEGGSYKWHGWR